MVRATTFDMPPRGDDALGYARALREEGARSRAADAAHRERVHRATARAARRIRVEDFRVVTVAEATAALESLATARPGAPRWAVVGLAGSLVGEHADMPRDRDDRAALPSDWSTRNDHRDQLIERCQPAAAREVRQLPTPPEWMQDDAERAAWVAHQRLSVVPRFVVDPAPSDTCQRVPGHGLVRLLAPADAPDPFVAEPRLRALVALVEWLTAGEVEIDLAAVGTLVAAWVGTGRWDTGAWLRRHVNSPRRLPSEQPDFARLGRHNPEAVTVELIRRAAPQVEQIERPV